MERSKHRYLPLFLILCLCCAWLLPAGARAQDAGSASDATLQRRIIDGLAAGKDVSALLEQIRENRPASASPRPPQSDESAQFQQQLSSLQQTLQQLTGRSGLNVEAIDTLRAKFEALQAARLLLDARFAAVQQRLAEAGVSSVFEERRRAAEEQYRQAVDELSRLLDSVLGPYGQAENKQALLKDLAFRKNALAAFKSALDLLAKHAAQRPLTILRASALPFRRAGLAQRAPVLSPAIIPSYRNPSDSATQATLADLSATVDAPLTQEILQKARELNHDYIAIYEFVRNTIATEWYAGAMKGAVGTLRQKSGNDVDQASLLIALYRASGLPARYVHGVIELPIDDVMNSLGLSDAGQATLALTRAGIAYSPVVRGGRVAAVNIEHTWVSAHVPYTNYRGAVVDISGKTWVPLMPALKRYDVVLPAGLFSRAGLTADSLIASYLSNEQTTDLLSVIRTQATQYLLAGDPTAVYEQQLGSSLITPSAIGLLPNTLPVNVVAATAEQAELDDARRQRVRFVIRQGTGDSDAVVLDHTVPLSTAASERVTLSYIPATVDDHKTVNTFGGLDYVPAYLVKLRPQIKINGRQAAVAEDSLDTGALHRFEVQLLAPHGTQRIAQTVIAGGYHAIGLYAQQVARVIPESDPADTEYLAAKLLDRIAWSYSDRWNKAETELAGLMNAAFVRPLPTVAVASNAITVDTVLGRPTQLRWQGVTLDAALRVSEPVSRDGSAASARDWMRLSALQGSALEHLIFEDEFVVDSISADKGLRVARSAGIPVRTVTSSNVGTVLPGLNHPAEVKADIQNWVRLGMSVEVPDGPLTYNAWQGSVWRVEDPATGAGGYFIAGGLAGGSTSVAGSGWLLDWLRDALLAANTAEANADPLAAVTISKLSGTDGQQGEAGKELSTKLAVMVRDRAGFPVVGAPVVFSVIHGGGTLDGGSTAAVLSNALGIADVTFELGQKTMDFPVYVMRNPADRYVTRAGLNLVEASVVTAFGSLAISEPFSALGLPGQAVRIRRTDTSASSYGLTGMWSDVINAAAEDQFGNSVSNVAVTYSVGGMQTSCDPPPQSPQNAVVFDNSVGSGACPPNPVLGDCGSGSFTDTTTPFGASAGVIMGNSNNTVYTVTVSGPGAGLNVSYQTLGGCTSSGSVSAASTLLINENGVNISAAKVGEFFKRPVRVTLFYELPEATVDPQTVTSCDADGNCTTTVVCNFKNLPDRTLKRTTGSVTFEVSNGGSSTGASMVGEGTYETRVLTGSGPGLNTVTLRANQVRTTYRTAESPGCAIIEKERTDSIIVAPINGVYGLDPRIDGVLSQGVASGEDPKAIHVNESLQSRYPAELQYTVPPSAYTSSTTEVDLFEDGTWRGYLIGTTRSGAGVGRLPRGESFDPDRVHEAQVVVNRGSDAEVKSDKFPIPVFQKLFKDVTTSFSTSMDVDMLNQRVCYQGAAFEFTLTDPATVTLKFKPRETGSEKTILSNQHLDKGKHTYPILPTELLPGKYDIELRGVSDKDGHEEVVPGKAISQFTTQNRLPVGHTIVKGVDVYDGSLATGTTDFSVPGRGRSLEFRRSYGSNGSAEPGRLGVGWSHNYDSKVIITECGEVIVIGAEGGGMRFVDDGHGGLRPLKGYHGTLIANQTDRTFDFTSKDGTRYHYRNLGTRVEWNLEFIQDANGNVTKLGYDPTSPRVAKLITVEDPAGRTLKFTYEDRAFIGAVETVPVITKIEGPAGITMAFSYDDQGNLVRAARENDARVELYAYSVDNTLPLWLQHKLTTYTDPNGRTTTYTYNEKNFVVPGQGTTLPTIYMPYSVVNQVREPAGGTTGFTYDFATRKSTVTNARGNATTYSMNEYGSVLQITDPVGTTGMTWAPDDVVMTGRTDANGVRTDYTYDSDGNLLTETVAGASTTYTYQQFTTPPIKNRVRTRTDRNGRTTTFAYDSRGNLVRITDPEGGVTEHAYAANGDRIQTKDPNGNVSRFTYDDYGNLASTIDALGGKMQTTWNARSLPVQVIDPLLRRVSMDYDTLNRMVRRTDPFGNAHAYAYDAVGNKLTETDEEGRITAWTYDNENRVLQIKDPAGSLKKFTYDGNGNKTSESDWKGNVTSFEYDAADRMTRRTEPLGRITGFSFDAVGNVKTETDALSRVTQHDYDALNRRIRTTNALAGVREFGYDGVGNKTSEKDPLGRTVAYAYDGLDRLVTKTEPLNRITKYRYDANGNRIEETDALNRTRQFVFDALNRPIKRMDAYGNTTNFQYDAVGNLIVAINARLFKTTHAYDELNRRTRTTVETGSDAALVAQHGTSVTEFGYDKVGNLVEERLPNGNIVRHTYDALNRLTATTDTLGSLLAYGYDANGNRTSETDANSNTAIKTYDELNQLVRVDMPESRTMRYGYDLVGNKTSETDPNGSRTTYAYDDLNRLLTLTDPLGKTVVYTYDAVGNKLTEKDKRGNATRFAYDDLNRVTTTTDPLNQTVTAAYDVVGNKTSDTDKRGTVTTYTYDRENRLISTTKADVVLSTAQYDELGRKKFEADANGNITTWIYDDGRGLVLLESRPLAAIARHKYDAIGNRIETRDPEGRVTTWTYDARRRMLTEKNGDNETTTYAYDGNGNRIRQTRPLGNAWAFAYDGANRLADITDPLSGVTHYTYDRNNNRLSQQDAEGNTTGYEYDALNRQTAMVYADGERAEFRYDENGNRIGLTDPKGQVFSYVFDALNRETDRNYPLPAAPTGDDIQSITTEYDENGNPVRVTETYTGATGSRVTTKAYDVFDRLIETVDAFGKTIKYLYDANGNRTALTDPDGKVTRYTYDALNRVSNVTNAGGITAYEYDRSSLKTRVVYPNGTTAVQSYDRARRIVRIENKQNAATVSSFEYTYDDNGNRIQQIENNGVVETTAYRFDATDRLVEVRYPDKATAYTYDRAYNRLTEKTTDNAAGTVLEDRSYAYNSRNQLATITDHVNSANSVAYTYDDNGNQITKIKNGTVTTFAYDVRDQLVSVQQDTSLLGRFSYDYQGLRVVKEGAEGVVRYAYDDRSVLLQTDGFGLTIAKYDYGPDRLLSLTHVTEGRQYYLFDALGSVSNLTTPAGTVQARYGYDAWGHFRSQSGASWNRFTFTGHEQDVETGLYYFKARFYDPDTGRFLSQDPYLGDINTPPSLHQYLYAYANPTVYIDLYGYYSWDEFKDDVKEAGRNLGRFAEGAKEGATELVVGVGKLGYEVLATTYDLEQAVYYGVKGAVTGEIEDVQWTSAIGRMAEQGATTGDIAVAAGNVGKEVVKGIANIPVEYVEAIASGDPKRMGKATFNLEMLLVPFAKGSKAVKATEAGAAETLSTQLPKNASKMVGEAAEGPGSRTMAKMTQRPSSQVASKEISSVEAQAPRAPPEPPKAALEPLPKDVSAATKLKEPIANYPTEPVKLSAPEAATVDRIRNVAQRGYDYAVENPRVEGLNRMQLGKDAEIQATRWLRKWAERNEVALGEGGLRFQVRGPRSVPDVMYDPSRQIFDFKLTPKAIRPAQTTNFLKDFPGYDIDYIFGPGPWR